MANLKSNNQTLMQQPVRGKMGKYIDVSLSPRSGMLVMNLLVPDDETKASSIHRNYTGVPSGLIRSPYLSETYDHFPNP